MREQESAIADALSLPNLKDGVSRAKLMIYEPHEICKIFPKIEGTDFESLRLDILSNGLIQPVVLYEGKILDGRNRYSACLAADVPARFVEFEGDDPVRYVVSMNLKRRHLSTPQRAMIAATLSKFPAYRRAKRETLTLPNKGEENECANLHTSIAEASKMLNVSRRSVSTAKQIEADAIPALQEKVMAGDVSLHAASKVAKKPKAEQKKIVKSGEKAIRESAREPDKNLDYTELDALKGKIQELCDTICNLEEENESLRDSLSLAELPENERVSASDIITQLRAENKSLKELNRVLESRLNGDMHERNAMLVTIKGLQTSNKILDKKLKIVTNSIV